MSLEIIYFSRVLHFKFYFRENVLHFSTAVLNEPKETQNNSIPPLASLGKKLKQLRSDYETPHFKGHDNESMLKRVRHLTLLGHLESALLAVERIRIELTMPYGEIYPNSPINRIEYIEKIFAKEGFEENQIGAQILSVLKALKPRAQLLPLEAQLDELAKSCHINERIISKISDMVAELEQNNVPDIPYDKITKTMSQAAESQLEKQISELMESPFLAIRDFALQAVLIAKKCGVDTSQAEAMIESNFPKEDYFRESAIPDIKDRVAAARKRIEAKKA